MLNKSEVHCDEINNNAGSHHVECFRTVFENLRDWKYTLMKPQVKFGDYKWVFRQRRVEHIDQTGCDRQISIIKAAVKRERLCRHLNQNYQHEVNTSCVTVDSLSSRWLPPLAFGVLQLDAEPTLSV
jgi:hypothetical protein